MKTSNYLRGSLNAETNPRKLVKMNLAASLPGDDKLYFLNPTPDKHKYEEAEPVFTFNKLINNVRFML